MKTTVTDSGASVASPSSIDEALETGMLPRDPHFLKTGRFADDKAGAANRAEETEEVETEEQRLERELDEEEQRQQDEQDSATSGEQDGETAAASQAAETQRGKTETRTREGGESRWAKLSRENRELREREAARDREIAELRAKVGGTATRDGSQASQPAAAAATETRPTRPEPKIDDVENGKAKYADYAAWQKDLRAWDREQVAAEIQATTAKTERERQQREAQETISREWTNRVVAAEKDLPDFRKVALDNNLPIKAGSIVDVFVLDSPIGPKVLYHLAKNREELERIQGQGVYDEKGVLTGFRGGLNPLAQARELTKLELKLSGSAGGSSSSSSARTVTQAPRPAHQLPGKGTVSKDAVADAIEEHDQTTYNRSANERDPRLAAVRRARQKSA